MPRSRSMAIQSEVAKRAFLRARTEPAVSTAPAYSRNFSVSVVFPASGWEMIANVRGRAISSERVCMRIPRNASVREVRGRGVLQGVFRGYRSRRALDPLARACGAERERGAPHAGHADRPAEPGGLWRVLGASIEGR